MRAAKLGDVSSDSGSDSDGQIKESHYDDMLSTEQDEETLQRNAAYLKAQSSKNFLKITRRNR